MKRWFGRIGAIVIALLFLVTSLGFSFLVIWQSHQDNKKSKQTSDIQKAFTDAQNKPKEGQLQGTKLANFTPVDKVENLQIIDTVVGTGAEVKAGDTVTAHYTGALAKDGIIFESSLDSGQPVPFGLDQVIPGWTKGVPGMKVGGKRRLLIPANLGYGEQGKPPKIGPNEPLVFDIELIKIGQ